MKKIIFRREQFVIAILVVIILILSVIVFKTRGELEEKTKSVQANEKLADQIEELENRNSTGELERVELLESIEKLVGNLKVAQEELEIEKEYVNELELALEEAISLDEFSEEIIRSYGVTKEYVENDLRMHPELISIEPVLGGIMGFYNVKVINDQYVYADFEDGHIYGYGLYQYQIKDKTIEWKEIIVGMPYSTYQTND